MCMRLVVGHHDLPRAAPTQPSNAYYAWGCRYLRHIEAGYCGNPYHNATHAADVLQSLHVVLHRGQLVQHYTDPVGLMAAYLAAVSDGSLGQAGVR